MILASHNCNFDSMPRVHKEASLNLFATMRHACP